MGAKPAREQPVPVRHVHDVTPAAARRVDRPGHDLRPHVQAASRVPHDGGSAGRPAARVDAHHLLARHREHPERVVRPQVLLAGEGDAREVIQRADVTGPQPHGVERRPVVRHRRIRGLDRLPEPRRLLGAQPPDAPRPQVVVPRVVARDHAAMVCRCNRPDTRPGPGACHDAALSGGVGPSPEPGDRPVNARLAFRPLVVVAAIAAFGLTACGSTPSGDSGGSGGSGATSGGAAADGVKLVSPGKLTTCTHLPYSPFQSKDDSGKTVGFDVDLIDLAAKKLGVTQDDRRHPVRGHQVRRRPQLRQVRRGRRRHDHHRRAQGGAGLLRPVLRRHPGARGAGPASRTRRWPTWPASGSGCRAPPPARTTSSSRSSSRASRSRWSPTRTSAPCSRHWPPARSRPPSATCRSGTSTSRPTRARSSSLARFDTGEQYGFAVKKGDDPKLLATINEALAAAQGGRQL